MQFVAQGHDAAVDPRADAVVADLRMDRVREVDRRGAPRKGPNVALWSKHVDLVLKEVDLDAIEELLRILDLLLVFHQLPQPLELLGIFCRRSAA